ncbi:DinB family protein [Laceyella sacchari]|uniref:DinB family protein n=1 Tax=Laceyella sacchari TaxID=37482 RepID=A0ABY5U2J0_LACSH|nr:DinB family protein [Laceyella sacchari]UWE03235.1 DinB family protein [Laceyella sacchari]
MTAICQIRQHLFEELDLMVRTTAALIEKIEDKDWHYQPQSAMRTLLEVVNHLVQIPTVDLAIIQEQDEISIRKLEKELFTHNAVELLNLLHSGADRLKSYMADLTVEDFVHKTGKPFYSQEGISYSKWLIEILTHLSHHRSQLFEYLKELHYNVNMFDLY